MNPPKLMMLSNHFSLAEATISRTASLKGIDNTPSLEMILTLKKTAEGMERVRTVCGGAAIHINSWYRCPALDNLLSSPNSEHQHAKGEAVDFIVPLIGTPFRVCQLIVANRKEIGFDKLILEHSWIHIAFRANPDTPNRDLVLSLLATGKYATGLTDKQGIPIL